jgi:hypothetical protein
MSSYQNFDEEHEDAYEEGYEFDLDNDETVLGDTRSPRAETTFNLPSDPSKTGSVAAIKAIPGSLDPRKRMATAKRAKWFLLLFIVLTAFFVKALSWRLYAPINSFMNEGAPVIRGTYNPVTGKIDNFDITPKYPYGFAESDVRNLKPELKKWSDDGTLGYTLPSPENSLPYFRDRPLQFPQSISGEYQYSRIFKNVAPGETPLERRLFFWLPLSTFLAAIVAFALPRLVFSNILGKWRDPVDAARDWLVTGFVTGIFSIIGISLARSLPGMTREVIDPSKWWILSAPIYAGASILGVMIASRNTTSVTSNGGRSRRVHPLHLILQPILVCLLVRPLEQFFDNRWVRITNIDFVSGFAAFIVLTIVLAVLMNAWAFDKRLQEAQGGSRGVLSGSKPLELNITVVGGKSAGKTVFLAGAWWQWNTELTGRIKIEPSTESAGDLGMFVDDDSEIDVVANSLYTGYDPSEQGGSRFPQGTATTRLFQFDMSYVEDDGRESKVATFRLLDYPGGALIRDGQSPRGGEDMYEGHVDPRITKSIYDYIDRSDAVLYIEDMSALRRGVRGKDTLHVMSTVKQVVDRVFKTSKQHRIVPLAVVMTKCDEFVDQSGAFDNKAIEKTIRSSQAVKIAEYWKKKSDTTTKFSRVRSFKTTAITYSKPQRGSDGKDDMTRPFIPDEPPSIKPGNCLDPLLWLCRECMHWNVTAFADLKGFILGSSSLAEVQRDAIDELERILAPRDI